jgi:hypothetical protein
MVAIMSRAFIRRFIASLLVLLLPLHAAAAAPLAVCAEMMPPAHAKVAMPHCEQMADMPQASAADQATKHDRQPGGGCWLGSICVAGVSAFAMPMQPVSGQLPRGKPVYAVAASHYRSIILDTPPRPPAIL